jgi:hypothetical protein
MLKPNAPTKAFVIAAVGSAGVNVGLKAMLVNAVR